MVLLFLQKKVHHLEDRKFASEEYLDPEIDERDSGPEPQISPLDQPLLKKTNIPYSTPTNFPQALNPGKSFIYCSFFIFHSCY